MKKILYLIIIIPLIFSSCGKEVKEYYKTGELYRQGFIKKGNREGVWKYFNKNGDLIQTINYKDDLYDGLWTNYFPKNQKIKDKSYYVKGKRIGTYRSYYQNGRLKTEGYLKNKMRYNTWKYYYPNGQLKKETKWEKDIEILTKHFDEYGNLIDNNTHN